jgi:hypothetical protein
LEYRYPPYIASVFEVFLDMENGHFLRFLLIRLWISFGDSLHRWKRLEELNQPHIQREAGTLSYMWGCLGFVHSIHTPYYYY